MQLSPERQEEYDLFEQIEKRLVKVYLEEKIDPNAHPTIALVRRMKSRLHHAEVNSGLNSRRNTALKSLEEIFIKKKDSKEIQQIANLVKYL
jgi:hypothetical protein